MYILYQPFLFPDANSQMFIPSEEEEKYTDTLDELAMRMP